MYELCKKCIYDGCMDVCIRCFNYSSYKNKDGMWLKENPHIPFKESYKKDEDMLTPNEVRDFGKEFDEFIKKRVKEIKERENMKDFTIDEISTTYNGWCYEYDIKAHSTKSAIDYLCNENELKRYLIKDILNKRYGITRTWANPVPPIKDVRFNGPATIVFWEDGTKTVVKAVDEDVDYEKGLAMAIAKKALGNKGKYFNEFKKWLPEGYEPEATIIDFEKFKVKFKSFEEATRAILEMNKKEDEDKQKKEKKKASSRKKKDDK